jgi:MFS family permease
MTTSPSTSIAPINEDRLYTKVIWRLVPFLFILYIFCFIDRVNIGFAKLQMTSDLGWSDTISGTGAGMFFFGYFLLQVPGNIILSKLGARRWLATIMVVWGLISASMMFVHTAFYFYVLRFSLGLAEAGFFPGVVFYLTFWFPSHRRGKVVAMFYSAMAVAGVVGGFLAGWIMHAFDNVGGLRGWQWLFVLEALPTLVLSGLVLVILKDSIQEASWLTTEEKALLAFNIVKDQRPSHNGKFREVLANGRVWVLCGISFLSAFGIYSLSFWLPQIIKDTGVADPLKVGMLSAIPYAVAVVVMIAVSTNSDRTGERRWHLALSFFIGALGLVGCGLAAHSTLWSMVAVIVATSAILSFCPLFWAMPAEFLSGTALGMTIGLINSVGNLGGFFCPYMIGVLKDATHSTALGLYISAVCLVVAGSLILARQRPSVVAPAIATVPA